jgi:hypothetical protein
MGSDNPFQQRGARLSYITAMLMGALFILMSPLVLVSAPPVALRASFARVQNTDTTHPTPASFDINLQETPYNVIVKGQNILVNSTKVFYSVPDDGNLTAASFPAGSNDILMALIVKLQEEGQLKFPGHFAPMRVVPNSTSYKQVHRQAGARYQRTVTTLHPTNHD